jgi:hypothetical protein
MALINSGATYFLPFLTFHIFCSLPYRAVGVLAADSQSTSTSGYRASLWDPWPDFILLFFFRLTTTSFSYQCSTCGAVGPSGSLMVRNTRQHGVTVLCDFVSISVPRSEPAVSLCCRRTQGLWSPGSSASSRSWP